MQAAAVPVSGGTALHALRLGGVRPGRRVMVVGATGGVGSFAVQIAKARGAAVTAVCGPGRADLARSLGADDVIDHTREEVDRDGPRHDVVLDLAGRRPISLLRRALTPRGVLVLVGGGHATARLTGGLGRQLGGPLRAAFSRQRVRMCVAPENAEDLRELGRLIDSGAVTPLIDRAYPLAAAPDAIRHLSGGRPAGKIVITVGSR